MRKKRGYWTKERAFEFAQKFNNKSDFQKEYISAYELLRKNGWLNEATKHMERPKNVNKKWDYNSCKNAALKCSTLKEFRVKYGNAYKHSKNNDWLGEFTQHMSTYKRPIIWTKNKCIEEAKKYETRNDFAKKSKKTYSACVRNNWLDEVCNHMKRPNDDKFKWTKEKCHEIALKYKYRKEFQNDSYNAYQAARYNGWLDEICQHMKLRKKPNNYWHNKENCKNKALEYKTKTDFIRNSQHVYNISLKNGWLDEICQHMIPRGDKYHRCIYSYEFSDNHVYVGLTYDIDVRERLRRIDKNDAVTIHINKTKLKPERKQLTEYISVEKAIELEKFHLDEYIKNGWIPLNRVKTGSIGGKKNFNDIISIYDK